MGGVEHNRCGWLEGDDVPSRAASGVGRSLVKPKHRLRDHGDSTQGLPHIHATFQG